MRKVDGWKTHIAAGLIAAWGVLEPALTDGSFWDAPDTVLYAAAISAARAAFTKLTEALEAVATKP